MFTFKNALALIEACNFSCEGGPLENSAVWQWLKARSEKAPDFFPGQRVWYEVKVTDEKSEIEFAQWVEFTITGCRVYSGADDFHWSYDLSRSMPAAYHAPKIAFSGVNENDLRLFNPTAKPEGN